MLCCAALCCAVLQVLTNQQAVEFASACASAAEGAQRLLQEAQQRWATRSASRHRDDITVAVAFL